MKNDDKGDLTYGPMMIASCQSATSLTLNVLKELKSLSINKTPYSSIEFLDNIDFQFSDGEICVRLNEDVNGRDVFLIQCLKDPTTSACVNENYLGFLIAIRAFKEWGAHRVTGILPYLAYARQDKPTTGKREPITAKLMADLSVEAGLDRLVVWAPHDKRVQGFYGKTPMDSLSPIPMFHKMFQDYRGRDDVIGVAPDAGAANFVIPFCRELDIRCAISSKYRPKPEKALVTEIMGDFNNIQTAIILDDMINTGGTIQALIEKLYHDKGVKNIMLCVSHFLGSTQAIERLKTLHAEYGLERLIVTDSIPLTKHFTALEFTEVISLGKPLAEEIHRIHHNLSFRGKLV